MRMPCGDLYYSYGDPIGVSFSLYFACIAIVLCSAQR